MIRGVGALMLTLLSVVAQETDDAGVRAWIERLRSDRLEEREEATRSLKALGRRALPALERASADPDPELADRARRLVRTVTLAESLGARLTHALPGIEERLAADAPGAWSEALRAAAARDRGEPVHPFLTRDDLDRLAARACSGAAEPAEKLALCALVRERRLPSAGAALVKWLEEEDVAAAAAAALGRLNHRDASSALLRLLDHERPDIPPAAADAVAELADPTLFLQAAERIRDPRAATRVQVLRALRRAPGPEFDALFLEALRDDSPNVRLHAVEGLRGRPGAEPGLVRALSDAHPGVQRDAAAELARRRTRGAEAQVLKLKDHESADVRREVLRFAVAVRAESALLIARSAVADADPELRLEGLYGLASLARDEARKIAAEWARDASPEIRSAAASALSEFGREDDNPALLRLAKDVEPDVRSEALRALAALAPPGAVAAAAEALRSDPDPSVRSDAAETMRALAGPADLELLRGLVRDGRAPAAPQAIQMLAELGDQSLVPALLERLRTEGPGGPALPVLVKLGAKGLLHEIRKGLGSARAETRAACARALGRIESVPETALLRPCWTDASALVRAAAAETAGLWKAVEAAEDLRRLAREASENVRHAAFLALARLRDPAFLKEAESLLDDPEPVCRVAAIDALAEAGLFNAGLIRSLAVPDGGVSLAAARALGRLRVQAAAPALSDLARTGTDPERAEALRALARLPGAPGQEPALEALRDPRRAVRVAAAILLCAAERREGAEVLIDEGRDLWAVNAWGDPAAWARWRSAPSLPLAGPRDDLVRDLARASGSTIIGPDVKGGGRVIVEDTPTRLEALLRVLGRGREAILEGERVRVVDTLTARRVWGERLRSP